MSLPAWCPAWQVLLWGSGRKHCNISWRLRNARPALGCMLRGDPKQNRRHEVPDRAVTDALFRNGRARPTRWPHSPRHGRSCVKETGQGWRRADGRSFGASDRGGDRGLRRACAALSQAGAPGGKQAQRGPPQAILGNPWAIPGQSLGNPWGQSLGERSDLPGASRVEGGPQFF